MFKELSEWLFNYYYSDNSVGLIKSVIVEDGSSFLLNATIALIIIISIIILLLIKIRKLNKIKFLYYKNRELIYNNLFKRLSSEISNATDKFESTSKNNLQIVKEHVSITKNDLKEHTQNLSRQLEEKTLKIIEIEQIQKSVNSLNYANAKLKPKVQKLNEELKKKDQIIEKLNTLLLDKSNG